MGMGSRQRLFVYGTQTDEVLFLRLCHHEMMSEKVCIEM